MWSGGCDSTLLLHELASRLSTPLNPICAVSVDTPCYIDEGKVEKEKQARESLISHFATKGLHIEHFTVEVKSTFPNKSAGYGCTQPLMWIGQILPFLGTGDHLYMGYIRGDDFWHQRSDFNQGIDHLSKVLHRDIHMRYPLEWEAKSDIIAALHEHEIYEKTWYCEAPTEQGEKCQSCVPCVTHNLALTRLVYEGNDWARKYIQPLPPKVKTK